MYDKEIFGLRAKDLMRRSNAIERIERVVIAIDVSTVIVAERD